MRTAAVRAHTTGPGTFQPLSRRLAAAPLEETLYEGVPGHLVLPLRYWLRSVLTDEAAMRVGLHLRLAFANGAEMAEMVGDDVLLDVVDALLWTGLVSHRMLRPGEASFFGFTPGQGRSSFHTSYSAGELLAALAGILRDGGSAYQVNADGQGLERRVDPTVAAAAREAVAAAADAGRGDAADLLRDAWARAYGLHPDPGEAYSNAVKSVEAVACPLFLPSDGEPTLGRVRAHLDQSRHRYEMVVDDRLAAPASVDAVVEMVSLLWHGQRERHAGGPSTASISQASAEAAVHLAATLVQWFSTGAVRRK